MEIKYKVWDEKYRPKRLEDCILSKENSKIFSGIINSGYVDNMIFRGGSGLGKSTVAKILCESVAMDYLFINASDERGIDLIRNTITKYAETVSLVDGATRKMVILDEADNLSNDAQLAFKAFTEQYAGNCGFILTCNKPAKIIDAIHSRCPGIDFNIPEIEKKDVIIRMYKRCSEILDMENIKYDKKVLAQVVKNYYPDFRTTILRLQMYSKIAGVIDEGIFSLKDKTDLSSLVGILKTKDFVKLEQWVENLDHSDMTGIYYDIYKELKKNISGGDLALSVTILGKWQNDSTGTPNQELNLLTCLTHLMVDVSFK